MEVGLVSRKQLDHKGRAAAILDAVQRVRDSDPQIAFDAARWLVNLDSKTATRPLLTVLSKGPKLHSREFTIYALRSLRDRRAIRPLCAVLSDRRQPAELRDEAAEALAVWVNRSRPALRALLYGASDPAAEVRWSVARALAPAKDSRAIEVLMELAHDHRSPKDGRSPISAEARQK